MYVYIYTYMYMYIYIYIYTYIHLFMYMYLTASGRPGVARETYNACEQFPQLTGVLGMSRLVCG